LALAGLTAPGASAFGLGGIPANDAVNNQGGRPSLSADGRYLVFKTLPSWSSGHDGQQVFVRDTMTGRTTLVSRHDGVDGSAPSSGASVYGSISSDGRYVVFASQAPLTAADPDVSGWDVYVRDLSAGTTTLVSRASGVNGVKANANPFLLPRPAISADGRYVVFGSTATNLSAQDTDTIWDVYVRDLQSNVTTLVSGGSAGPQGNSGSSSAQVSADGRLVAFSSDAALSPDDTDANSDVYIRDMVTQAITLVSRAPGAGGADGNNGSFAPAISGDGRYVAFASSATNLSPEDPDTLWDIYVRDLQANSTVLASRATGAVGAKDNAGMSPDSEPPSISADGRLVAFETFASNLSPDDHDSFRDTYVRDLQAATTTLPGRADGAAAPKANDHTLFPRMAPGGRYVAFATYATNLVPDNSGGNIFVRDLQDSRTWLESRGPLGYPRPKAATPLYVPLVPAYQPCTVPDRVHAASLSYGSCSQPDAASGFLTLGTPDSNGERANSTASVRLASIGLDVAMGVSVTDVRNAADLSDYAGELRLRTVVRATDRLSPVPGDPTGPATVVDIGFGPSVPCVPSPDTTVGSTCSVNTSVNALIPGYPVVSGARSIWEFAQIVLDDGGADGDADTPADNTPFLAQGVFVP